MGKYYLCEIFCRLWVFSYRTTAPFSRPMQLRPACVTLHFGMHYYLSQSSQRSQSILHTKYLTPLLAERRERNGPGVSSPPNFIKFLGKKWAKRMLAPPPPTHPSGMLAPPPPTPKKIMDPSLALLTLTSAWKRISFWIRRDFWRGYFRTTRLQAIHDCKSFILTFV